MGAGASSAANTKEQPIVEDNAERTKLVSGLIAQIFAVLDADSDNSITKKELELLYTTRSTDDISDVIASMIEAADGKDTEGGVRMKNGQLELHELTHWFVDKSYEPSTLEHILGSLKGYKRFPLAYRTSTSRGADQVVADLSVSSFCRLHVHLISAEGVPAMECPGGVPSVVFDITPKSEGKLPPGAFSAEFPCSLGASSQKWDSLGLVLFGASSTEFRVRFTQGDGSTLAQGSGTLLDETMGLPATNAPWEERELALGGGIGSLKFRVRASNEEEVTAAQLAEFEAQAEQTILELDTLLPLRQTPQEAVLRLYRSPSRGAVASPDQKPRYKALLWIPGRNDVFHHLHMGLELHKRGYDIYALSLRNQGHCRRLGMLEHDNDPMLESHPGARADFSVYAEEIEKALSIIRRCDYGWVGAYAHSSGAAALLDYLDSKGDGAFDAFVLNSPFLDWVGDGDADAEASAAVAGAPAEGGIDPCALKTLSLYAFDPSTKPIYNTRTTNAFVLGMQRTRDKIEARRTAGDALTQKPILLVGGGGSEEKKRNARSLGPAHTELELGGGEDDVLLSIDSGISAKAVEGIASWLDTNSAVLPAAEETRAAAEVAQG